MRSLDARVCSAGLTIRPNTHKTVIIKFYQPMRLFPPSHGSCAVSNLVVDGDNRESARSRGARACLYDEASSKNAEGARHLRRRRRRACGGRVVSVCGCTRPRRDNIAAALGGTTSGRSEEATARGGGSTGHGHGRAVQAVGWLNGVESALAPLHLAFVTQGRTVGA